MLKAPIPKNEAGRLSALHKLALLDTRPELRFDRITRLALSVFRVTISTITLVDSDREWFKSCQGLPSREGSRDVSFCGHALLAANIFVVPDTKEDKRFRDNPMVVGKPHIRFYAGVAMRSVTGERIGVFCIKDTKPRSFSLADAQKLKDLAAWAELEINSRHLSLAITELKKLHTVVTKRVEESEQLRAKDESILASIGDGLIVVDKNRKIMFFSKSAEEMTGWKSGDALGKHTSRVIQMEDENGKSIPVDLRPIHLALSTKKKVTSTSRGYYFVLSSGKKFPASITATPVILNKNIIGAVLIFRDITKEREIDQAKTEFVSLASHQLRTPTTAINWFARMLLNERVGKLNADQRRYVSSLHEVSQQMGELISVLLDVSRMELGTFSVKPEKASLENIAESCIQNLAPELETKKITIRTNYEPKLPKVLVDPKWVYIIFQNLLTNAINYSSPSSAVQLSIKLEQDGGDKSYLITVEDSGIGIPLLEQDKIFTKLFRAGNAKKAVPSGTGLGLYIVKSILEHTGGAVWFKSVVGRGTAFYVRLPLTGMKQT